MKEKSINTIGDITKGKINSREGASNTQKLMRRIRNMLEKVANKLGKKYKADKS